LGEVRGQPPGKLLGAARSPTTSNVQIKYPAAAALLVRLQFLVYASFVSVLRGTCRYSFIAYENPPLNSEFQVTMSDACGAY